MVILKSDGLTAHMITQKSPAKFYLEPKRTSYPTMALVLVEVDSERVWLIAMKLKKLFAAKAVFFVTYGSSPRLTRRRK